MGYPERPKNKPLAVPPNFDAPAPTSTVVSVVLPAWHCVTRCGVDVTGCGDHARRGLRDRVLEQRADDRRTHAGALGDGSLVEGDVLGVGVDARSATYERRNLVRLVVAGLISFIVIVNEPAVGTSFGVAVHFVLPACFSAKAFGVSDLPLPKRCTFRGTQRAWSGSS